MVDEGDRFPIRREAWMAQPTRRLEQNPANRKLKPAPCSLTTSNNRQTGAIRSPVSRSHVFSDLSGCAPLQRYGSQRSESLNWVELWFQEHCQLAVSGNREQLARSDPKWAS